MLIERGGKDWGDLFVLHKCGRKICFRPKHLKLGTRQENTDDSFALGEREATFEDYQVRQIRWMGDKYGKRRGFKKRYCVKVAKLFGCMIKLFMV